MLRGLTNSIADENFPSLANEIKAMQNGVEPLNPWKR
jgi:hypothetical protein